MYYNSTNHSDIKPNQPSPLKGSFPLVMIWLNRVRILPFLEILLEPNRYCINIVSYLNMLHLFQPNLDIEYISTST